jgi:diguanylate cyclase (GGDEF)-like protein
VISGIDLSKTGAKVEHAVRIASVDASIRVLVRRTGELRGTIELGPDAANLRGVTQLIKLATLEDGVTIELSQTKSPTAVELSGAGGALAVPYEDLKAPLGEWLVGWLARVVGADDLALAAHGLAADLARKDALRGVVDGMLAAKQLDDALAALVAGVTAGPGLGFHRAALFVAGKAAERSPDELLRGTPAPGPRSQRTPAPQLEGPASSRGALSGPVFTGRLGVGPTSEAEAHRIWESLEAESVSFTRQLERATSHSAFDVRARSILLSPGSDPRDEVRAALKGEARLFSRPKGVVTANLARLDPASELVLVPVVARERVLGLLYADMKFGAEHIEPARVDALVAFVAHAALVWSTIDLLREVDDLARHDPLTGLWNRRELEARLVQERSRVVRSKTPLSFLLIDIDHFREVNNTRGHVAGDGLLRAAGSILRAELRGHDVAARFGGDELAVLLPGAGSLESALVARRIGNAALRRGLSVSIGAASFPDDTDHPDDLLQLADKSLYEAKAKGRGRACLTGADEPIVFDDEG